MENKYAEAIKKSMTRELFLGYYEYHYGDKEWGDLHQPSYTFRFIREYNKQLNDPDLFLKQFSKDIFEILDSKLSTYEFLMILTYIYMYLYENIEIKSIERYWNISDEIKLKIIKHHNKFEDLYSNRLREDFNVNSSNDGFNLKNINENLNIIHNKYNIDLLNIFDK